MAARSSVFGRLSPEHLFALVLAAVLAVRVAALLISPLDLHFDEAQYWTWSRTLDWGYYSKPPLVAWAIRATTAVFGDAEWSVRLAAPLAHAAGAWMVFLTARRVYGAATGAWAGLLWFTLPALWLSSFVIATDALLLPLWAAALYVLLRLTEGPSGRLAALLGLAIGLGALAKYAMLFFAPCAVLAALVSPALRRALASRYGAFAALVAAGVFAPNLAWNAAHRFQTVAHTAANANLSAGIFHPEALLEFLLAQAGVIGPVLFAGLIWLMVAAARTPRTLSEQERVLLTFALLPLLAIATQALLSRAHANWAAVAYPAAIVLVVGRLARSAAGVRVLWAAAATHLVIGALAVAVFVAPSLADRAGVGGALKRMRGWHEVAAEIADRTAGENYSAVLVDHRAAYFELAYYWRDRSDVPPVRAWRLHAAPENPADAADPMRVEDGARVLVAHMYPFYASFIAADFRRFTPLGASLLAVGTTDRTLTYSLGETFDPVARDAAFEERYRRLSGEAP